ncbi:MAG: site-specific integrase [bacterium]
MKGSVKWQTNEIFNEIKEIGNSKYEAKNAARAAGAHGSAGIAEKTGIYSNKTSTNYRNAVAGFGTWAKENLHLKDITKTTPEAVKSYLYSRIDSGVAHKTFQSDKSALNKFQSALNKYSQSHNLNRTYAFKLNETFKGIHKSLKHSDVRAYDKQTVTKLLNIGDKAVNLAVRCALNAGLRKSEILKLGSKPDSVTKDTVNVFGGKGGKDRTITEISDKSLISDIKAFLKENNLGKFGDGVTGSKINYQIGKALGKDSGSIHALRHNYVINTITSFEKKGYSHVEAVHFTSIQVGHNRNEVIEGVYLR